MNSSASVDGGGAKSKQEFKPTIPVCRAKAQETQSESVKEEKFAEPSGRGRGRRDGPSRGRGRGRPELIQVYIFKCLLNLNILILKILIDSRFNFWRWNI